MKALLRLFLMIPLLLAGGCAALQEGTIQHEEAQLTKAGFRAISPTTEKQKQTLASMTPYRLEARPYNGTTVYRYADPKAGVLYVGGEAEHAAYEQMTVKDRARRASNLAQVTSTNWRIIGPIVW